MINTVYNIYIYYPCYLFDHGLSFWSYLLISYSFHPLIFVFSLSYLFLILPIIIIALSLSYRCPIIVLAYLVIAVTYINIKKTKKKKNTYITQTHLIKIHVSTFYAILSYWSTIDLSDLSKSTKKYLPKSESAHETWSWKQSIKKSDVAIKHIPPSLLSITNFPPKSMKHLWIRTKKFQQTHLLCFGYLANQIHVCVVIHLAVKIIQNRKIPWVPITPNQQQLSQEMFVIFSCQKSEDIFLKHQMTSSKSSSISFWQKGFKQPLPFNALTIFSRPEITWDAKLLTCCSRGVATRSKSGK